MRKATLKRLAQNAQLKQHQRQRQHPHHESQHAFGQVEDDIITTAPTTPLSLPLRDESFLLELDAYNRTICMHLFPNVHLLAPNGTTVFSGGDVAGAAATTLTEQETARQVVQPLDDDRVRAYRGYVIAVLDHRRPEDALNYDCGWYVLPCVNYVCLCVRAISSTFAHAHDIYFHFI